MPSELVQRELRKLGARVVTGMSLIRTMHGAIAEWQGAHMPGMNRQHPTRTRLRKMGMCSPVIKLQRHNS